MLAATWTKVRTASQHNFDWPCHSQLRDRRKLNSAPSFRQLFDILFRNVAQKLIEFPAICWKLFRIAGICFSIKKLWQIICCIIYQLLHPFIFRGVMFVNRMQKLNTQKHIWVRYRTSFGIVGGVLLFFGLWNDGNLLNLNCGCSKLKIVLLLFSGNKGLSTESSHSTTIRISGKSCSCKQLASFCMFSTAFDAANMLKGIYAVVYARNPAFAYGFKFFEHTESF